MFGSPVNTANIKTTSYKVVIPFYLYSALSFLLSTILIFFSSDAFTLHYFHPHIFSITHIMALGWGTMVIFGAGHQLIPVLIEGKLYSDKLAYATFILAAVGIPMLAHGFFLFDMGDIAKWGGRLVLLAILAFFINVAKSVLDSKGRNVHIAFVLSSISWLFVTAFFGLMLVYNFTVHFLSDTTLHYLPLHAHAGVIGWFLLLVIGMASRLIPMFLISKYTNTRLLWIIFYLINTALIGYIIKFYFIESRWYIYLLISFVLIAIILFIYYCYQAYKHRLRKAVDEQVKISILSVIMMLIPIIILTIIISILISVSVEQKDLILTYGFIIFFGWITAIILGMAFKTLPFIVWNKVYHKRSSKGKAPSPKDLFNHTIFNIMSVAYLLGFILFTLGIILLNQILLNIGSLLLILTAILYNWNIIKVIFHKPMINE